MRLIINFSKQISQDSFEKDVSPNETVQDLKVLISLTVPEFNTYDLYYNHRKLSRKQAQLKEVIDSNDPNITITVVKRGFSTTMMGKVQSIKTLISNGLQRNPELNSLIKKGALALAFIIIICLFVAVILNKVCSLEFGESKIPSFIHHPRRRK